MPAIDRNLLQEGASLQGQIVAVWAHTGRGLRLAETERAKVLECWRNSVPAPRLVIAAAGGSPGMADPGQVILSARSMARRALDLGADAVLVHPPTAFRDRPDRDTLVLDYHATIAEVGLPLILFYLHEEAGGVHYGTETLSRWLERPEVVGIKVATLDSVITFQDLASLIEAVAPGKVLLPRQERSSQTGNHGTTQPFEGVQSCVRAQSYAGCKRIGSWCRLRKLGCSGIYVEYDRFGVLVNDDSLLLAALAPRIIRKR